MIFGSWLLASLSTSDLPVLFLCCYCDVVPATAQHTPGFDLAYPLVLWAQPPVAPGNEELNFLFVQWIRTKTALFNLAGKDRRLA